MTSTKKNILERFENGVDRFIGIFSPRYELKRTLDRVAARKFRSEKYAAAKTNRMTGAWNPLNSNVNSIIGASWDTVTARVRQLVRDFPYFARAVDIMVDYSVGAGILFQSRNLDADGKLNKQLNTQIEDAFKFWADEADISKKLHYYELMALAKRQDIEAGEFLLVKKVSRDTKRFIPYALQMYETDWLTSYNATPQGKNEIERGVEYDTITGEVMAYHFTDPDAWGKTIRVKADDVIHGFKTLRPGQMRGITPFAPGVLVAGDLDSIMNAEIDAAKMASKYLAFVYTDNPYARQTGTSTDDNSKRIDEMENAIIEYLRSGEKIEIASNPRPGGNFAPFVKLVLTMLAITTGTPVELISGNYDGFNYSNLRMKRNDFLHELKPVSTRHIRQFCSPTIMPFFESCVMSGKLNLPYYFSNPLLYLRHEWQTPGMESIDPLRETKAKVDEMNTGIRSPQEIVKARGRDLEDVYNEIAEAKAMADELGLDFSKDTNTALANNPAAVDGETEDNEDGE